MIKNIMRPQVFAVCDASGGGVAGTACGHGMCGWTLFTLSPPITSS